MTREEAIAVLRREIEPSVYEDEKSIAEAIDMAIQALSADAVSRKNTVTLNSPINIQAEMVAVVRCKDCKWAEKAILDEYCVECTMYHTSCMKHGYCHHGERSEE